MPLKQLALDGRCLDDLWPVAGGNVVPVPPLANRHAQLVNVGSHRFRIAFPNLVDRVEV